MPEALAQSVATAVRCISTGRVRTKRGERGVRRYLPGGWRDETLPVNVFLVEHPDGLCLFDAGQAAAAARPGYFPFWYPFFRLARFELGSGDEVASQLESQGISPDRVRWVVLSHLHTDHVGGLAPLAGAEVIVSSREWERACGLGGRLRGYLPQYWPEGLTPVVVDFPRRSFGPFESVHPLTKDGSLLLVPTPGHTPGHLSLLVRDAERQLLLCGDLVERAADLDQTAPAIADWCRRDGVEVLPTHDDRCAALALGGRR
jgi:glyoxylase-like metal-dependent hydrolase (beta-lactamase superfamily II)